MERTSMLTHWELLKRVENCLHAIREKLEMQNQR